MAPTPPKATTKAVPTDAERSPTNAEQAIDQTLEFMAELRELPARKKVVGRVLSREQMVAYVEQTLRQEVPPEVLRATNAFLYLAGVVESDFDYEQSLLNVLGTELAGFYDPKAERMYLGADLGLSEQRATLVHELVHALQDQHYGLADLTRWLPDASDRLSAVHSLAEGDATSAMLDGVLFGSGRTSLDLPDELVAEQIEKMQNADPSVPGIVKRSVVAPYVDGLRFVHALRLKGGWGAVDEAWRTPPGSTEQVLHPEKYFAREPAVEVAIAGPGPRGPTSLLYHDVEGEQALRLLLEEWLPRKDAALAASGWGGDRLALYADDTVSAFVWKLRFDTGGAAQRAYHAVTSWVHGQPIRGVPRTQAMCRDRSDRGPLGVLWRDAEVAIVGGPAVLDAGGARGLGTCADAAKWLLSALGS